MGKEALSSLAISEAVQAKMAELAELVSLEQYGPDGPPLELTFSEIEAIGHAVGRLTAGKVDATIQQRHADYFSTAQPCPQCGQPCEVGRQNRPLQTIDGEVGLTEPTCHCDACKRSFFPSASSASS